MGLENKTVSFIQTAHNPFILCKNVDRPYLGNRISRGFTVFVKWSCPSTSSLISHYSISLFSQERSADRGCDYCSICPYHAEYPQSQLEVLNNHHDVANCCGPGMSSLNPWVQFRELTKSCKKREVYFSADVHAWGTSGFVPLSHSMEMTPSRKMCVWLNTVFLQHKVVAISW